MSYTEIKNNGIALQVFNGNSLFDFNGNNVEVFVVDGKEYFNMTHVGNVLGIKNVHTSTVDFDEFYKVKLTNEMLENSDVHTTYNENSALRTTYSRRLNNIGEMFLTESGVYRLVFKSRKAEALEFQQWVFGEVLPQIRRTGGYIPVSAEDTDEMIRIKAEEIASKTVAIKDEIIAQQQAQIEKLQAEVDFHKEDVKDCERLIDVLCNDVKYLFNDTDFGVHSVSDAYTIMSHNVNGSRKFVQWFNERNEKVKVIDIYVDENGSRIKNAIDLSDINIFHDFKDLVFAYQQEQQEKQGFSRKVENN